MSHMQFALNYFFLFKFPDVDECTVTPDTCGTGGTCTNNDGSYTCTCADGYIGAGDATPCTGKLKCLHE